MIALHAWTCCVLLVEWHVLNIMQASSLYWGYRLCRSDLPGALVLTAVTLLLDKHRKIRKMVHRRAWRVDVARTMVGALGCFELQAGLLTRMLRLFA